MVCILAMLTEKSVYHTPGTECFRKQSGKSLAFINFYIEWAFQFFNLPSEKIKQRNMDQTSAI